MKFNTTSILLGILAVLPLATLEAKEELAVIQAVSKDRRSFVIAKGIKDGVLKGQEIIFANDNVSIVCRASEINRDFSLWVPVDRTINIPFKKEDIVSSSSTVYGNVALEVIGDSNLIIADKPVDQKAEYKKFIEENNFSAKIGYNKGLAQSSSSVGEDKNNGRVGYSMSLEYNYRFMPEFEMSLGGRIDNDVYRIEEPELDIPTKRILGIVSATYHLVNFSSTKNNFYLTVSAGIGSSETTIDETVSTGHAILLPEARIGYLMPLTSGMALLLEGSVESINATESFTDGEEQTTNSTNMKFTVGLRF